MRKEYFMSVSTFERLLMPLVLSLSGGATSIPVWQGYPAQHGEEAKPNLAKHFSFEFGQNKQCIWIIRR